MFAISEGSVMIHQGSFQDEGSFGFPRLGSIARLSGMSILLRPLCW